jgi:hypothetical protein
VEGTTDQLKESSHLPTLAIPGFFVLLNLAYARKKLFNKESCKQGKPRVTLRIWFQKELSSLARGNTLNI